MSQAAAPADIAAGAPRRGSLLAIFLTVVVDLMGFGLMMPLLVYYAGEHHASPATAGMLIATFSLMQLLCAPVLGRLSDRFGRRPILLLGLMGSCASYALFAVADSLAMLFVARALAGAFGATISTAQAYVADVTTPETRAKGMGAIGAAFGIGYVIGPLLAGTLWDYGPRVPAIAAACLSFTALLIGFARIVEPPRDGERKMRSAWSLLAAFRALLDPARGALLVVFLISVYCFAHFEAMFTKYGNEQLRFEKGSMAYMVAFVSLFIALVQGGMIRRLVPKYGEAALLKIGLVLLAIAFILLGTVENRGLFFLACALLGTGYGLASPTLNALISKRTAASEQGETFGVTQSLASLGRLCGHYASGVLYGRAAGLPFLVAGALWALCLAIVSRVGRAEPAR